MSGSKTSSVNTIKASSERIGALKNINTVREFSFTIDQPVKSGGTNEAPTPMEYILGSFNGCVLIVIEVIAKEIDFEFQRLKSDSVGTIDPRGMKGIDNISPHFQEVTNTIWIETDENEQRIEELKEKVKDRCPAYNLFKDAGISISLNWNKVKESVTE